MLTLHQWPLLLPFKKPPLSGNSRWGHWSQEREAQQTVKKATWLIAKKHKIPSLPAISVQLVWYVGRNGRYDTDNIYPTLKPAIDGLVQAGVIPDDNSEYVPHTSTRTVIRRNDPLNLATPRLILCVSPIDRLESMQHYTAEGTPL